MSSFERLTEPFSSIGLVHRQDRTLAFCADDDKIYPVGYISDIIYFSTKTPIRLDFHTVSLDYSLPISDDFFTKVLFVEGEEIAALLSPHVDANEKYDLASSVFRSNLHECCVCGRKIQAKCTPVVVLKGSDLFYMSTPVVVAKLCNDCTSGSPIEVSKSITFSACHYLPYYQGNCAYLHGHDWKVVVKIRGFTANNGMLLDFKKVKKALKFHVHNRLDHNFLNLHIENPTAENIARWIAARLILDLPLLTEVCVYESPDSFATYKVDTEIR